MRNDQWNSAVERVMKHMRPRIESYMNRVYAYVAESTEFEVDGDGVDFFDADEYSWRFRVYLDESRTDEMSADISLEIAESPEYEGTEEGINFMLNIVMWGGRILGGLSPYNYTSEVWVPLADTAAIEERFALIEQANLSGIAECLRSGVEA